jgi:hypothetical protein
MKERNKRKIRKAGFKKLRVIVPRKKLRKKGGSCRTVDYDFEPLKTQQRRAGRMIRKGRGMAQTQKQMHVVK